MSVNKKTYWNKSGLSFLLELFPKFNSSELVWIHKKKRCVYKICLFWGGGVGFMFYSLVLVVY